MVKNMPEFAEMVSISLMHVKQINISIWLLL